RVTADLIDLHLVPEPERHVQAGEIERPPTGRVLAVYKAEMRDAIRYTGQRRDGPRVNEATLHEFDGGHRPVHRTEYVVPCIRLPVGLPGQVGRDSERDLGFDANFLARGDDEPPGTAQKTS